MKKYSVVYILLFCISNYCSGQDSWQQLASFPSGSYHGASAIVISGKIYCIGGYTSIKNSKNVWEYDPITNVWTKKADFPFEDRSGAVFFSIGNKGYYGMGLNNQFNWLQDFFEYDPDLDSWTRKANYPIKVGCSVGFSISGKGYVCSGNHDPNTEEPTNYFAEYNPESDSWTEKAPYPHRISQGSGFVINNKAYVGLGQYYGDEEEFIYRYDPILDGWTRRADLHSTEDYATNGRYDAISFSIGDEGYMGFGHGGSVTCCSLSDFWRYDVQSNSWAQIATSISAREDAIGCSIDGVGYIGLGNSLSDFWRFIPACSRDLILNNTFAKDRTYQASQTIMISGDFNLVGGDNLILSAGASITLKAGFTANSSSIFRAKISSCQNSGGRISGDEMTQTNTIDSQMNIHALDEKEGSQDLLIFPNPTNGLCKLILPKHDKRNLEISVTNSVGQSLKGIDVRQIDYLTYEINLSECPSGILFVKVQSGMNMSVKKIVKK